MFRRWLIRGLALTLLMLCIVAWVGSYFQTVTVAYFGEKHSIEPTVQFGLIHIGIFDWEPAHTEFYWWHKPFNPENVADIREWYQRTPKHFLGFAYSPVQSSIWPGREVFIPLWFPTLLSTLVFWLVWRKTRVKPIGNAFPIEPNGEAK